MLDYFFPRTCFLCSAAGDDLCVHCQQKLKVICRGVFCTVCGKPFTAGLKPHPCSDCTKDPPAYDRHRSIFLFDENIKKLVHQFKYQGDFGIKRIIPEFFGAVAAEIPPADIIIPVPLHVNRLRSRGYNQSLVLARVFGKLLCRKVGPRVLKRVKDTPTQTGLDRRQREQNLKKAFGISGKHDVGGKKILLVDDVHTTGVTLNAAASVLKSFGAGEVYALTLAFVPSGF
ncbi:MAG: ComF family protein [Deltaproteobacteria bacterium]|nr:ComF family protein [Deltaproteobacteria bacterium]